MTKDRRTFSGTVSRRSFNGGMVAIGAVWAATGLFGRTASAQSPKQGGRLRVGLADLSSSDTLDPQVQVGTASMTRAMLVYDKLTDFDFDGKLVPQLAESWEGSADGREWSFKLRDNVAFHNGKTLGSADVIYSLNRILDKATASPARAELAAIETLEADGPARFKVKLKAPNAEFPYFLAIRHVTIIPEGATDFSQPVGTGAFMLKEFVPGLSFLAVKNPNYRVTGQPYLDEVELIGIPDAIARTNALLTGEVDVIQRLDTKSIPVIENSGRAKVMSAAGKAHVTFPMRPIAPLGSKNVATALKHAFDRQAFINQAYDGYGVVGRDQPISQIDPSYCDTVPVPQRDPDKVKFFLNKAGHLNTNFELHASDLTQGGVNVAIVLTEMMRESGVQASVKRVPSDGYLKSVWLKAPWCVSSWTGRPTALAMLEAVYSTNGRVNETAWSNPTFDALLTTAKAEMDAAKRHTILCEAQTLVASDCTTLVPVFLPFLDAHSNSVQNLRPHPAAAIGSARWEEVWIDA